MLEATFSKSLSDAMTGLSLGAFTSNRSPDRPSEINGNSGHDGCCLQESFLSNMASSWVRQPTFSLLRYEKELDRLAGLV
jgi:hypothetical protein